MFLNVLIEQETEEKTPKREKVVCYQCSFEAKRVRIMENHVKDEHEGVSKCQECDYTATSWLSVKKHIDQAGTHIYIYMR